MKKQKNRGITLVALIITIIVMLILVAVTVTVVVDSDIIGQAEQAGELYKDAYAKEGEKVSDDEIRGEGLRHNTIEGYIKEVTTYAVGDIITLKNTRGKDKEEDYIEEDFYVIKDEGDRVILLSKYNIKEDDDGNWIQDTTGAVNPIAFSSTNYWSSETITNMSLDLNTYTPADLAQIKDTDAIQVAKQYADQINNATEENGRLMTLEEIKALGAGSRESWSIVDCPTWIDIVKNASGEDCVINFWLGSAGCTSSVWHVDGEYNGLFNIDFDYDDCFGVRPVLVISKSLI